MCLVSSLTFSCGVAVSMFCLGEHEINTFRFRTRWTVGSVRLAVCKDIARLRLCWSWKVVVWTHTDFAQCGLYIFGSASANISAVLNCKRAPRIHSSWQRGVIEIVQDGDFRMFVTDVQANVACTGVLLIQAWSLTAMLKGLLRCYGWLFSFSAFSTNWKDVGWAAHRDFAHIVASMSCVKLLDCHVVVFVVVTTLVRLFVDRAHAQLAGTSHTPHSTLYTLYTPHSTLYTSHSLLYTPHSTLYTFHSTLQTGNRGIIAEKCSAWLHIHVFPHLYH